MRWRLFLLATFVVFLIMPSAHAAVRHLSVQELNESESKFLGVEISVEGRVGSYVENTIRFRNCNLTFRLDPNATTGSRGSRNVEATGQVVRENGKLVFVVSSLRTLPSDAETFLEKKRRVRSDSSTEWYALADWAARRGTFYSDQDLLSRSDEARTQGVNVERKGARGNPAQLLALADRVQAMDLPQGVRESLIHEAYHTQWKASRTEKPEQLATLAAELATQLPGSTVALAQPVPELIQKYESNPIETYDASSEETRKKLHRFLYADVHLRVVMSKLAADAKNGFEVADLIDQHIPEQHALAESLRDKALASRAAEVEKLSRREMLALRDEYVAREQPEQGERIVETWLALRRRKMQKDDTEGWLQLADEYRTLLKRNDTADHLLMEEWQRNPAAAEVSEQLERQGYRLKNGKWLTQAEFNAQPEEKLEQALREGRIEVGMTGQQVRRGLGEPLSLSRSATAGQISEVWTYGQVDATRLTIHLSKRRGQAEPKVVGVAQVRTP